jgi:lipoate-protein ligase A
MLKKIQFIESIVDNPYQNLAVEKCLFDMVEENAVILYLWQNERTVVYGRNQNVWKECNVSKLLGDGGHPARRLSGGGAVYHDLGNLNFTFLAQKQSYDVTRQMDVILKACQKCGIDAEKTGRNDITVNGRKFSGNAFYHSGNRSYHHGTILIDSDLSALSGYLNVDKQKLQSKGVTSVKARVTNLCAICPDLTVERMKVALKEAFTEVYQQQPEVLTKESLDLEKLTAYQQHFQSEEWLYGKRLPFSMRIYRRFAWGDFDCNLNVNQGKIQEVILYSDALEGEFIERIQEQMLHMPLSSQQLAEKITSLAENPVQEQMAEDIRGLFEESI